ncbi:MAG TPA: RIP metalloprotease RseP [Sphingomicrobium sp.]
MTLAHPPLWVVLLAFICALGPLVFFHELGHYLVARLFKVPAETFSIGFGRELIGWTDKQGTRWKVAWLPLGGYVKFVGDMGPASTPADGEDIPEELRDRAFQFKPVWQRFLIVLAGPVANFLLAIAIFAAFFTFIGAPLTNVVGTIEPNSAAARAGLQPGDKILSIAGRPTPAFEDIRTVVMLRAGERVTLKVERDHAVQQVSVTLKSVEMKDIFGRPFHKGQLGVQPTAAVLKPVPVWQAIPAAFDATVRITAQTFDILSRIVTGQLSAKVIGGPIAIAKVAGEGAAAGPLAFIGLLALLSINLGFINLLPVVPLDGGHLFFYIVEAVRRRPVSAQALDWSARGGVALILLLMIFATGNDLGLWDGLQRLIG